MKTTGTALVWIGLLVLVACQSPADNSPPTIASSIPATGSEDIAVGSKLAIVFSKAMKQDSLSVTPSPAINLGTAVWNDAKTAVYTPVGGWQAGTTYTLSLEGKDLNGNALSGNKTLSFKTAAPPDTTAPATPSGVKATVGDGEFFVSWNANPEPDLAGYTLYLGDTADGLVPVVFVEKPTTLGKISGLENGKTYFFAVDAQDTSGNRSLKTTAATVSPKDMVAPTLVSSEPAHGTQDIALVPFLRFTFSEPMNTNSVATQLCINTDPPATATCTSPVAANFGTPTWSNGDTVVQFTPTDQLQGGKTNVLLISATDKAGNPLSGSNKIAFSIRSTPDTTAPTVSSRNVAISDPTAKIKLSFSEGMDQKSVQDSLLSAPTLSCTWVWQGNDATCSTGILEQLTTYTITLGITAKDTAGNPLQAPYQFTFETPNFAPRVTKFTPSSRFGSPIGVSPTSPIVLTFSEPMDQALTQGAFEVKVGTTLKTGTFSWNAEGTQMTYTPSAGYGNGATVVWKLSTGAYELSGGPGRALRLHLVADVSSFFQTQQVIKASR